MGIEGYSNADQQENQKEQRDRSRKGDRRIPKWMQRLFRIEDEHEEEQKHELIEEVHTDVAELGNEVGSTAGAVEAGALQSATELPRMQPPAEILAAPVEPEKKAVDQIQLPETFGKYLTTPWETLAKAYDLTLPSLDMPWLRAKTIQVDGTTYSVINKGSAYTGEKGYTTMNVWDMYFGSFRNWLPEGRGKMVYRDGSVCEWNFKNGLLNGDAMMHKVILRPNPQNPTEDIIATYEYIGNFVDGKRQWVGYYKRPDGQTLVCNRENDRPAPTTLAKMTYPAEWGAVQGDTYEGNLQTITDPTNPRKWQVLREGQGTYTYADGKPAVTGMRRRGDPVEPV